jgi:hypothetical protein
MKSSTVGAWTGPVLFRWIAWLTLAAVISITLLLIGRRTGFASIYSIDDPYIHLAVGEEILRGNYGVNPAEPASASSSILFDGNGHLREADPASSNVSRLTRSRSPISSRCAGKRHRGDRAGHRPCDRRLCHLHGAGHCGLVGRLHARREVVLLRHHGAPITAARAPTLSERDSNAR